MRGPGRWATAVVVGALIAGCSSVQGGQAVPIGTPVAGSDPAPLSSTIAVRPVPGSSAPGSASSISVAPTTTGPATVSTVTVTASSSPRTTTTAPPTTSRSAPTAPTVKPDADPAPTCWTSGTCPALATADLGGGWKVVAVNPDDTHTVMILLSAGRPFDQLAMRELGARPVLDCVTVAAAPTCLMSGVPGAHTAFGSVARVSSGRLVNLTATLGASKEMFSEGGFTLSRTSSSAALIVGLIAFNDYGLSFAASPKAWTSYVVGERTVVQSGCSAPAFEPPAEPRTVLRGPCTGTPQISGYPAGSANKILSLDAGFTSPSGNIWCVHQNYSTGDTHCTINQTDFAVPANCTGQPGTIVGWPDEGTATISGCQGDIMVTAGRTPIAYGQLAVSGDIICVVSQTGGVRCENSEHHGFVLARAKFSAF